MNTQTVSRFTPLTRVIRLTEDIMTDAGWTFSQPEEGLLTGCHDGHTWLVSVETGPAGLGELCTDCEYLTRVKKTDVYGVMLAGQELYFRVLENMAMEKIHSNREKASEVQQELERLLTRAVNVGASDVHITRRDTIATVELRINGVLVPDAQFMSTRCDEMVFVLYNVEATTRETTWNRAVPQSANILYTLNDRKYRFRYAHFPIFGETEGCYHAVLRIIPSGVKNVSERAVSLSAMGVSDGEAADIRRILSNPYGGYFIAGTTGSGKSSTLKVLMEWLQQNRFDSKGCFLTVEDPVEYQIAGARQSSVLDADKGGFHTAIKSSLRRDPDVLMVGEIRDGVSASALAGAVESGHYCFTTVHAGNIVTLLQRLVALTIGSDKLSTPGFIAGLQCQKLLPVLCDHCKTPLAATLGGRQVAVFARHSEGCEHCNHTGVTARQLVIEYMRPNSQELAAIARQQWLEVYTHWRAKRQQGSGLTEGFDLREKAAACVLAGRVCYRWFSMEFGDLAEDDMRVLVSKLYRQTAENSAPARHITETHPC